MFSDSQSHVGDIGILRFFNIKVRVLILKEEEDIKVVIL